MKHRTHSSSELEKLGRGSPGGSGGTSQRSLVVGNSMNSPAANRSSISTLHSRKSSSQYLLPGTSFEDHDTTLWPSYSPAASPMQRAVSSDYYSPQPQPRRSSINKQHISRALKLQRQTSRIFDDPAVTAGYASVKILEQDDLPRGGISVDTAAVGRVQFGIPPETIKDSMLLGMEVPRVYIVPTERFCSDLGPALGINLAEFEFPAYFNWFVRRKKCCLVVDSVEAENNIRSVFEETLLGPKKFRDPHNIVENDDEDFDPDFPVDARPNFYKEFEYFRVSEKTDTYNELTVDMLLEFFHFEKGDSSSRKLNPEHDSFAVANESIGVPPVPPDHQSSNDGELSLSDLFPAEDSNEQFPAFDDFHQSLGDLVFSRSSIINKESEGNRKTTRFADQKSPPQPIDHAKEQNNSSRARRRASLESVESTFTSASANTVESMRSDATEKPCMYSQLKWLGEVATVWPMDATPEQIQQRSVPRVEIFKLAGFGTEYVIHDVDANNVIIGKARLRGTVRVPDEIAVEGFLSSGFPADIDSAALEDHSAASSLVLSDQEQQHAEPVPYPPPKALFHPPSFGVTVLGNSHGFDKNGSTSGYVLWINGRGIMIDPPPYSSATLEREGIRPQMIFGVMITHCHADHDAGAFQKVLTGSRLTVITTPSIYTSFIRKYSALSGLSPTLLQHSHRYRRAIIGQPLKFQGATFHFTYTLHTIPCISFKVEWRGRSMVFTGDHLNLPPLLDELEQKGILSKGRANSLKQMPLQDCDALLHEAGAPPIHTPLTVLQNLPEKIRQRLYVVHTSALPPDSGLRVAPTGTAGTIRLDEMHARNEELGDNTNILLSSASNLGYIYSGEKDESLPAVLLRPSCISDAWFILNLISNIPFFGTLSYINTMEVLEIASVEVFAAGEVIIPARKRLETLCVVWEGTCVEGGPEPTSKPVVWHAGDWTGPTALQPNAEKAAQFGGSEPVRDVVALSAQGVKVILLRMNELNKILMRGSKLYRQYLEQEDKHGSGASTPKSATVVMPEGKHPASRHVLETIKINPLLGSLLPRQIRAVESIAEGPRVFEPGKYLWKAGDPCDFAFLIASGTASFAPPPAGHSRSVGIRRRSHRQSSLRNVVEIEDGRIVEIDKMLRDLPQESEFARLQLLMALRAERIEGDPYYRSTDRGERNRNANKLLARLYASGKVIDGLLISRGCFLSDTSRMVSGNLVRETEGFSATHAHSSTVISCGPWGCVAWVFPRSSFLPFLESNPGVLLSLLGTQLVV